jgi:hypothetical protein
MALLLLLVVAPLTLPQDASGEDVEVSTTFLTFFKNGGGYIEYHLYGPAASELRSRIDDPNVTFPFETFNADGDGTVDQSEGEQYMRNLDDLLTRRQIVLRGVTLDNVDVDEHRGLIGTDVNATKELYLHITFRCHLEYEAWEFNVTGLEPLAVLYGSFEDIPPTLTIDERTYIVSAGLASYERVLKEEGTLLNMRIPMASVVSFHESYTASNPPSVRMEYRHNTVVGNPASLGILILIATYLGLKLPKWTARDSGMERVRELHLAVLVSGVLLWLFYFFGGPAVLVWVFAFAYGAVPWYMARLIYVQGWRGMAKPEEEAVDLGEAIAAADLDAGAVPAPVRPRAEMLANPDQSTPRPVPSSEVVVLLDSDRPEERVAPMEPPAGPSTEAQQAATAPPPAQPAPAIPTTPPAQPSSGEISNGATDEGTKTMKCRCGGVFKVPLEPRPLEVQCPHCGVKGVLDG